MSVSVTVYANADITGVWLIALLAALVVTHWSMLCSVSTWMGDRLQAGTPSLYVASLLGRLSLLPFVGW